MTALDLASRPARWLAGRTLRGRLVAGLLGTLTLACAVVGVLTYVHTEQVLTAQLDSQLAGSARRYAMCMRWKEKGQPPPPPSLPPGTPPGTRDETPSPSMCAQRQALLTFSGIVTTAAAGSPPIVSSPEMANQYGYCKLSTTDQADLRTLKPGTPQTMSLATYGNYRLLASHTTDGNSFVTGLPMSYVTLPLRSVALEELAVFALALVASGLIGTAWVRASLRPLRRVAATAARVTELPLASGEVALPDRVQDANPRTETGQLGAAFNRMLGHVESALARRAASEERLRRFAADASHELRTPLAAIRGYAELARRHPGPVPADIAHALSRVEAESARMSVLVDELLLLAQLDAGRPLASEPVDLTRLAIDVTSDARAAAPGHVWRLDLPDEPVVVAGDAHRLHQVMANLTTNAATHTPAGTTVMVSLTCPPGAARLTVTDDGPGIPPDLQPAVFQRFVRSARTRAGGSSGLGLAIVDAVTAAHQGTVSVTSEPGRTCFTIALPRLP